MIPLPRCGIGTVLKNKLFDRAACYSYLKDK